MHCSYFSVTLTPWPSKVQLPLSMNLMILLGVTVLVGLIFLVIAVLHYCCWRQPPPPEDPPAFDMKMDYGWL